MAAESITTLGTRRAVTAPSRRQFGASALAAACGAAFAGAVVLPDRGEAFQAPANPDAELIELCAAIDALQLRFDALCDGPEKIDDDDARMDAVAPITAEQLPLIDRMCEIRPTTLQGHMARARTYWLWDKDPPEADSPYTNEAMQGAILRDLAALVGEGA